MSNFSNPSTDDLIVLTGWAILNFVRPNMREINFQYLTADNLLNIIFYLDKDPSPEDVDSADCIETELMSQTEEINYNHELIVIPYPETIPCHGIPIYRRYEPNPSPRVVTESTLRMAATQAMLGRIHPNIRKICLFHHKQAETVKIYACFDSVPTVSQMQSIDAILAEISRFFSNKISWEREIVVIPASIQNTLGDICVYSRSEGYLEGANPSIIPN